MGTMGTIRPSRGDKVVTRYLERHGSAHPDEFPRLCEQIADAGVFDAAVVIPARDEPADFLDRCGLDEAAGARVLALVVVNAPTTPSSRDEHLLARVGAGLTLPGGHRVVAVDRCRAPLAFGPRDGVGLARKVGLDLALAAWRAGLVEGPWLHTTDADARLPPGHFVEPVGEDGSVARIARYWHDTASDDPVAHATALYEVWLRHWVAGLAHAGSPYAFDAIGSCIRVRADAYARVRGVPRRQAGEDFHLLAKLTKTGVVQRDALDRAPIIIRPRASTRVPFGTGPAVRRIMSNLPAAPTLHDPRVYDGVAHVVAALDDTDTTWESVFEGLPASVRAALEQIGGRAALPRATTAATTPLQLRRRRHEWFDGLRTLRFVHAQRDLGLADLPWHEALSRSAFVAGEPPSPRDRAGIDALRRELERAFHGRSGRGPHARPRA